MGDFLNSAEKLYASENELRSAMSIKMSKSDKMEAFTKHSQQTVGKGNERKETKKLTYFLKKKLKYNFKVKIIRP